MPASSKESQAVIDWRKRMKARLVEAMGGKCVCCGYNRINRNLVLHHINPEEKTFGISTLVTAGWARIVAEAKKCVLLCSNCHGEVHADILDIPPDAARFNEAYDTYEGMLVRKNTDQNRRVAEARIRSQLEAKRKRNQDRANLKSDEVQMAMNKDKLRLSDFMTKTEEGKVVAKPESPPTPREAKFCLACKSQITSPHGEKFCSAICYSGQTRKVVRPSKETLTQELAASNYLALGRKYGVSDNAIRKWVAQYNKNQ